VCALPLMPRKKMARRRQSARGSSRSFLYSGKDQLDLVVANGNSSVAGAYSANGSFNTAVTNISKAFEYYRIERLRFTVMPVIRYESGFPTQSGSSIWAFGWLPETTNSTTTTITPGAVNTLSDSLTGMASIVNTQSADESGTNSGKSLVTGETVPRHLNVSRKTLRLGLAKMYRTQSGVTGDPATIQGTVILALGDTAGANTVKVNIFVDFTIRFFEPVDTTTISRGPPGVFCPSIATLRLRGRPALPDALGETKSAFAVVDEKERVDSCWESVSVKDKVCAFECSEAKPLTPQESEVSRQDISAIFARLSSLTLAVQQLRNGLAADKV
jgi:hypothetical protein